MAFELGTSTQHSGAIGGAKIPGLNGSTRGHLTPDQLATHARTSMRDAAFNVLRDFAAIGDGSSHPLSTRYGSLGAAQAVYPHATSLTQEIDWAAIQGALNAAAARGDNGGGVEVPNTGAAYRINETLTLNPARTTFRSDGVRLDFSSLAYGKTGIFLNADTSSQYGHTKHRMSGFDILGPGRNVGQLGTPALRFNSAVNLKSSRYLMADLSIHGWPRGATFQSRSYLDKFHNVSIWDCDYGVYYDFSTTDAGENYSFVQCDLFNNGVAIHNANGSGMFFHNCSFDYNGKVTHQTYGENRFDCCHIEHGASSSIQFEHWGNMTSFVGCFYLALGAQTAAPFSVVNAPTIVVWDKSSRYQAPSGNPPAIFTGAGRFFYGVSTIASGSIPADGILG